MSETEPTNIDAATRAALLRRAPTLADLDDAAIAALAQATVVRHYPYKSVVARLGQPHLGRPLRLVLLGSFLVQTPGELDWRRCVGPGMLLGEEGVVAFAVKEGLLAPPPVKPVDHYVYAAEDTWVLELPADRFPGVFGAGAHPAALDTLRAAAWRTARLPELVTALRQTPELARATDDDLHVLLEGGRMQPFLGDPQLVETGAVVVVSGAMTMLENGREEAREAGAVIGQREYLVADKSGIELRQRDENDGETVILALPFRHYDRVLRARPELTTAVARALPGLARPDYPTEVALVLAAAPLQTALPLAKLTAALAQTIRSHLGDDARVVELVWADAAPPPNPDALRIAVPHGSPAEITATVQAGLEAILAGSWQDIDVLLVDPSPLQPDPTTQRALVDAVVAVPAPHRLSYMFSRPAEWARVLPILGVHVDDPALLPTVVLPPRAPAPGPGAALGDIGEGLLDGRPEPLRRGLQALPGLVRDRLRRLGDRLALHDAAAGKLLRALLPGAVPPQVWPKTAVRLRLSEPGRAALATDGRLQLADESDRESLRRWARALTGRRVGLALGGAGALSYLCVPLIRGLRAAGVPIDIVSGASFGAIVGAYYTALGEPGLELVVRHWYMAQITVLWGWVSTQPLQQWINFDLGRVDIALFDTPLIPVATNAYNGREWDQRAGIVGHACAASGSLPPLSPTYEGSTRLLDGALSADTPDLVLVESGARMVVGANPIPPPWPEPEIPILIPVLGELLRTLNPITRMTDAVRGYGMLFRQAAQNQERFADVTYLADNTVGNGATFFLRNALVYQGAHSASLQKAVALAHERWQELLERPHRLPAPQ